MLMRKCDICGREIRKTEGRYKLVFIGILYDTNKDVCADCIKRIADEIKQADTPQTECPVAIVFGCDECHRPKCEYKNCRRCKWFVTDKCHECFGNELFEDSGYVTQTESTGSPIGDYRDGVGAWQTDCGWK